MMNRKRTQWNRQASPPPATPGYDTYFSDSPHPAAYEDPDAHKYENGDPSSWGEDPTQGPYQNSAQPALPGYDEAHDHPADEPARTTGPKKAAQIRAQMERKAALCIRIATAMLGKRASTQAIEDQALDLMDLPDRQIHAALARLQKSSGGFLADEMMMDEPVADEMMDEPVADEMPMLADESEDSGVESDLDALMAEVDSLKQEMASGFRASDEEVEESPMLGEEDMPEEKQGCGVEMLDDYDTDMDGFVTALDWGGSPQVFAALDTDRDGIINTREAALLLGAKPKKTAKRGLVATMKALYPDLDAEEIRMLTAMEEEEEGKKSEEEEEEEGKKSGKKSGQNAKANGNWKSAEEEDEGEEDEGEEDEEEAGSQGKEARLRQLRAKVNSLRALAAKKGEEEEEDKPSEETAAEEEEEGASEKPEKEASTFAMMNDPMGLAGEVEPSAEDDALLAEIFGKSAGEDEAAPDEEGEGADDKPKKKAKKSEDEEDDSSLEAEEEAEEEEKEEKAKQARLKPQARKASHQVLRTVGQVIKSAAARNEVEELSKLWESAPDVSSHFGK